MKLLGIDYGGKKIGVAVSEGSLAEPLCVVRYVDISKAIDKIKTISQDNGIEALVIGVSEGKSAEEAKEFGALVQKSLLLPIFFQDETLSTKRAQARSIEAGMGRVKRKGMEDAYSATIILQDYLDSLT